MRWRPHILKVNGYYRVLWRSTIDGTLYPSDMIPYHKRRRQTSEANAFVLRLNLAEHK